MALARILKSKRGQTNNGFIGDFVMNGTKHESTPRIAVTHELQDVEQFPTEIAYPFVNSLPQIRTEYAQSEIDDLARTMVVTKKMAAMICILGITRGLPCSMSSKPVSI